ncbi:hypothetical protein QBC34DRAFT_103952 [Podospora aff. communis PSN243]|uniref:ER-bound oxygenase mpaB/mpaB'/Rubber oxygenase catalytic domain-containing protein n=1 Tax=Podospora aff. communis PSN243 TaxID=3040156 RepID=A0AAV9H4V0_9PEZI|nr:hypothetical protein QBC34DRAFT_103952 [Podospora aff. communis PSN243]
MAATEDDCPKLGAHIRAWDYEFEWTPEHMTPEQMRPLMFTYDKLATESLDRLDELISSVPLRPTRKTPSSSDTQRPQEGSPPKGCPHSDFYELLKEHAPNDPTLRRLWTEVNTVPDWVDWAEIERGQQVFYRFGGPSIVSLTFHALLGGMGSHRIVETLSRTGGFGVKVARRRLLETFQHVLDVTESLPSIQPGGRGFASTLRVRFLHASVRRRILRLAAKDPSYFDTSTLGIPISDLDSIGTVLTFSADLIWVGFPRQGIHLTPSETSSYLALWRYVAYLLGTPTTPLSTPSLAKAFMESIVLFDIAPSPTSCILANNIIAALQNQPPSYASASFLRAEAYWLNGKELATKLSIPEPPVFYTLLVAGQCLFFMTMTCLKRTFPSFDKSSIIKMRRRLRELTLEQVGGEEAKHAFQYVPEPGFMTTDDGDEVKKERWNVSVWANASVERRNMLAVVVAAGVAWVCAWNAFAVAGRVSALL